MEPHDLMAFVLKEGSSNSGIKSAAQGNGDMLFHSGFSHSAWVKRKVCTAILWQNGIINSANFHGPWGTRRHTETAYAAFLLFELDSHLGPLDG
jgi:hypothetical protein